MCGSPPLTNIPLKYRTVPLWPLERVPPCRALPPSGCGAPGVRGAGQWPCFWLTYRTLIFVRLYEHISPLKRVKAIHIMILVWCASAFYSCFASVHRFNFASLHRFFCFSLLIPRVPLFCYIKFHLSNIWPNFACCLVNSWFAYIVC